MARMPQIPQPEFGGRPGAGTITSDIHLPGIDETIRPLQIGAETMGEAGDALEAAQQRQAAADAKLQAVHDEAAAIKVKGDHLDRISRMSDAFQQQYKTDPQKAVEAYKAAIADDAAMAIKAAPPGVGLNLQTMLPQADNEAQNAMRGWARGQSVTNIKNQLVNSDNQATHDLGSIMFASGARAHALEHLRDTARIRGMAAENPQESSDKSVLDIYKAWVSQRSAVSPAAAMDMITQLADPDWKKNAPKGFDDDDRQNAIKAAQASYEGFQTRAKTTLFASHSQQLNNINKLVAANDSKTPEAIGAMYTATTFQMKRDAADRTLTPLDKEWAKERGESMLKTLDNAQMIYRQQLNVSTPDRAKLETKVETDLLNAHKDLFDNASKVDLNTHYADLVTLRQKAIAALAKGQISYQAYSTIENDLKNNVPAGNASEAQNTGHWFHRTARQLGNQTINDLFTSKYSTATPEQQNLAREYFIDWVAQIQSIQGAVVSKVDAQAQAESAVKAAMLVDTK